MVGRASKITDTNVSCLIVGHEVVGRYMAGLEKLDPRGVLTASDIERIGEGKTCFQVDVTTTVDDRDTGTVTTTHGTGYLVMSEENGVAWIEAAKGEGTGLTDAMNQKAIEWAIERGCTSVGCQTARPGLKRLLEAQGWKVTGYVMRLEVPHD